MKAKLSRWYRGSQTAHRNQMARPMTYDKMVTDPTLSDQGKYREDRALLERRACQYASFLAQRDGLARGSVGAYFAIFNGADTVKFSAPGIYSFPPHEFEIRIPDHILNYAPETLYTAPNDAPMDVRCEDTVDLEEAIAKR